MEGEREKSPINAGQKVENIDSVSSDGQETCRQPSSSTSALSSKPESPGKQMDGSERALSGMYFNLELHRVPNFVSTTGAIARRCELIQKHFRFRFQNFSASGLARADARTES
jgi:hypothetical protein